MKINTKLPGETKGFLDEEEGRKLYETALEAAVMGPCLEIGSYCGKSALWLGRACRKKGQVLFSIDHHRGSEEQQPGEGYYDPELFDPRSYRIDSFPIFRQTLEAAGLEDTVVPIVCRSELAARAWGTRLSLVFIDGGHSFDAAFADYNAWTGHIMPGGYLLIHDIFPNPADGGQAPFQLYQMALASGLFEKMPMCKTLGILKRKKCGEKPGALPPGEI
ncbi:MAG: class I SAM-dependent methyltransferase [Desulfococcaceae bacterium]|jgi:predicted O-methyltransferase YrrM|nr:class I SAM-dependent methyltransferase [Desulfococcaceae bacterium]